MFQTVYVRPLSVREVLPPKITVLDSLGRVAVITIDTPEDVLRDCEYLLEHCDFSESNQIPELPTCYRLPRYYLSELELICVSHVREYLFACVLHPDYEVWLIDYSRNLIISYSDVFSLIVDKAPIEFSVGMEVQK